MTSIATPTIAVSAQQTGATGKNGSRTIGDVILEVKHISLRFGGVRALTDISFDVR